MLVSEAPGQQVVLQKFELYSTKSHYYLVGHDKAATSFRLLKLSRLEAELEASSDPCTYTKAECTALLRRIRDGNIRIGGLQSVCKVRSQHRVRPCGDAYNRPSVGCSLHTG